jgi:hypothetical protein
MSVEDDNYDACKTVNTKFQADKSCQVGFNVLRRLYSEPFSHGFHWPSRPIPTILCTLDNLTNEINRAKFHVNRLRGFGLAGARKSYVSIGKHGRPFTQSLALPRLHMITSHDARTVAVSILITSTFASFDWLSSVTQ